MALKLNATVLLPTLTQLGASTALQAAALHASETGTPMSIAVVDAHTHLLAFTRIDSAKHSSIATALSMAQTAASNHLPTSTLSEKMSETGTSFFGSRDSYLCMVPGGLPIVSPTGALLGAIGCSTGTDLQGEAAAASGRDAALALVAMEAGEEERRIEEEREEVLRLWKEKEMEVERLRNELECERSSRGKRRKTSSVGLETDSGAPNTPPEEGEVGEFLRPSFVGEVRIDSY